MVLGQFNFSLVTLSPKLETGSRQMQLSNRGCCCWCLLAIRVCLFGSACRVGYFMLQNNIQLENAPDDLVIFQENLLDQTIQLCICIGEYLSH